MLAGYIVLSGDYSHVPLPGFTKNAAGNPLGPRRGYWALETPLSLATINLPARDKRVTAWAQTADLPMLVRSLEILDSEEGQNYREKLNNIRGLMNSDFVCAVNNTGITSRHSLLAIATNALPLKVYGLHDTRTNTVFIAWSTDPAKIPECLAMAPMRFLIYRFPDLVNDAIVFDIEKTCGKWLRWVKGGGIFQGFNAIEQRMYSGTSQA